jgi:hypothetical protein
MRLPYLKAPKGIVLGVNPVIMEFYCYRADDADGYAKLDVNLTPDTRTSLILTLKSPAKNPDTDEHCKQTLEWADEQTPPVPCLEVPPGVEIK